jgi:hypothetical protein
VGAGRLIAATAPGFVVVDRLGGSLSWCEACLAALLDAMVNPILLGGGKLLLSGLRDRVPLRLARTTVLSSGNVLLTFELQVRAA